MKKLLIVLLMLPIMLLAQVNEKKHTLSFTANFSEPDTYGIMYERNRSSKENKSSTLLFLAAGKLSLDSKTINATGTGFVFGSGNRQYFKENDRKGFYVDNYFTYGNINFNENFYSGTYQYISIVDIDLGYKIKLAKYFSLEPQLGYVWKIEIKGKGDVDNKSFNNSVAKFGVKIGYNF